MLIVKSTDFRANKCVCVRDEAIKRVSRRRRVALAICFYICDVMSVAYFADINL